MPRLDDIRDDLLVALDVHYGSVPSARPAVVAEGDSWFERLARVALGLVATPKVAAAAFDALLVGKMLDPATLADAHPLEVDDLLKQARVAMALKSLRPLQKLARWATDRGDGGNGEAVAELGTEAIRAEWRGINGIGLASADALLLFGLGRVSYPVDRATYRVLVRHGWLDSTAEYDEARELVERFARNQARSSPQQTDADGEEVAAGALLIRLSGWFERLGRDYCKPSRADCERCPLRPWLPPNGPVEME